MAPSAGHDIAVAAARSSSVVVARGNPTATIQAAIEMALKSGIKRILIAPGNYDEHDVVTGSGLTISAASEPVVLMGSIELSDAARVVISGLTFRGTGGGVSINARHCTQLRIERDVFVGTARPVVLDGTTDSLVAHNRMINTSRSAIEAFDGARANRLVGNVIEGDGARDTVGAIWLHGADGSTVSRNRISNTKGAAISLMDFSPPGLAQTRNDASVVADNEVDHVDMESADSGALYVLGRSQDPATGIVVTGNVIGLTGSPGAHAIGIYLDDNASGVTVRRNILTATPALSDAFEIHGGSNDAIEGNIFDLGEGRTTFGLFQRDQPDQRPKGSFRQLNNDAVSGNIFATESAAPRNPGFADLTSGVGHITVRGNDYWSFVGTAVNVAGLGARGDAAAHYVAPAPHAASSLADYTAWSAVPIGFTPINTSGRSSGADPSATR